MGILAWAMIPTIASHKLSKAAKVSVSIGDFHLTKSEISIDNIQVKNPSGYNKIPKALSVKTFSIVNTPISNYLDDDIIIDEINLDDIYLGLEFDSPKSTKGNWGTIMNNISQNTDQEKTKAKNKGKTKTILIKKLVITNLQVELAYKKGNQPNRQLRPIDQIELTNISSEGGLPMNQIMNIVMQETLRNIFSKEGLQNMLEGVLDPNESSKGIMNTLKGLFSENVLLDNDWGDFEKEEYKEAQ